jgi:ribonuclease HI
MWSLWMARNKRKHDEPSIPLKKAVEWTIDTAFDLWQLAHPIKHHGLPRVSQHWRPPPPGWAKCNVDASFVEMEGRGATGMVLRDQDGRVCGGRAKWYDHCLDALSTEAMACRDGLRYAIDRGVQRLQLETDCKAVVNLWEKRQHQNSEVGPLLQQIEALSRSLVDFSFIYSSRSCNMLAHECAKLVSRNNPVEEWLVPPPGLWAIINTDCNHAHDQ